MTFPDPTVRRCHAAIIRDCERTLARRVSSAERRFVTDRTGFLALEMIHDHVKSLAAEPGALERYLNGSPGGAASASPVPPMRR